MYRTPKGKLILESLSDEQKELIETINSVITEKKKEPELKKKRRKIIILKLITLFIIIFFIFIITLIIYRSYNLALNKKLYSKLLNISLIPEKNSTIFLSNSRYEFGREQVLNRKTIIKNDIIESINKTATINMFNKTKILLNTNSKIEINNIELIDFNNKIIKLKFTIYKGKIDIENKKNIIEIFIKKVNISFLTDSLNKFTIWLKHNKIYINNKKGILKVLYNKNNFLKIKEKEKKSFEF